MIAEVDYEVIDRCFDQRTLARARAYVADGAVLEADWDAGGARVAGLVQGSTATPYEVTVDLARARGRLVAVDGDCTCPVAVDCKHAAALLLSTLQGGKAPRRAPTPPARRVPKKSSPVRPTWDRALGAALGAGVEDPGDEEPSGAGLALQFELVAGVRPLSGARSVGQQIVVGSPTTRVRLLPVVPGSAGNWVRSGVSWRDVDHLGRAWSRHRVSERQVALLRELRAVAGLVGSPAYAAYQVNDVWLDKVSSRRIWDLLAEAEDLGIPLVGAGRPLGRVMVHRGTAEVVLDASARVGPDGITLRPLLRVGALEIPYPQANTLLIGTPAHGVAWWDIPSSAPGQPALSFAPLPVKFATTSKALFRGRSVVRPSRRRGAVPRGDPASAASLHRRRVERRHGRPS